MNLRKERVHHSGASNLSNQWSKRLHCPQLPIAQLAKEPFSHAHLSESARISPIRTRSVHDTIYERSGRVIAKPIERTETFYEAQGKELIMKTMIGYPRSAQLEEKDKRKPVFIGDSQLSHRQESKRLRTSSSDAQTSNNNFIKSDLMENKNIEKGQTGQESLAVGFRRSNNEILKPNINLDKVKEARKILRRKYANSRNLQRIYSSWNEDGTGEISIENVFNMSKKLGLNLNFDEARVLVATADKSSSESINLDDFIGLIYNKEDAIDVNLNNLTTFTEESNLVRKEQLMKGDYNLLQRVQENVKREAEIGHINQITLILKNRLKDLNDAILDLDRGRSGYVNFSSFEAAVKRLQINEAILSEKDIKKIFDKHKADSLKLDYNILFSTLKDFRFPMDLKHKECVSAKAKRSNSLSNSLNSSQINETTNVSDCRNLPYNLMIGFHNRSKRVGKAIQRFFPSKKDLNEYLANFLKIPQETVGKHYVTKKQVKNIITTLFQTFQVSYLIPRDFEGFFTSILYNHNGYTNFEEIIHTIYEETEKQFFEKVQMKKKGPPPQQGNLFSEGTENEKTANGNLHFSMEIEKLDSSNLKEERKSHKQGSSIMQVTERDSINMDECAEKTVNPRRSLLRRISSSDLGYGESYESPVKTKFKFNKNLEFMLNELDNKIFTGKKPAYTAFREFDIDKDGYVSYQDIITKLEKDHMVKKEDIPLLLRYLDPNQKGYVDFIEFSKKIRPNMAYVDENGRASERTIGTICKPDFEEISQSADKTKKALESFKKMYDPNSYNYLNIKGKTRSGANPAWNNTFQNFQPNSNVSMFISERERLDKDPFATTRFQVEDRQREKSRHNKKLEIIRENQSLLRARIEDGNSFRESRNKSALKQRYLAKENYEKNAKLRNVFI